MRARSLVVPVVAFAGGVVLGRLLGFDSLAGGGPTAAAVSGPSSQPALLESTGPVTRTAARRRNGARTARKRAAQRRSRPV